MQFITQNQHDSEPNDAMWRSQGRWRKTESNSRADQQPNSVKTAYGCFGLAQLLFRAGLLPLVIL